VEELKEFYEHLTIYIGVNITLGFLGNRYYLACNRCLRQAGQKVGREEDKRTHGKGGKKMKKELGFIQHPIS
jgi:hypothetical protein